MGIFKKNGNKKTYYLTHESWLDGFPRTATKIILDEDTMNLTFNQIGLKSTINIPVSSIISVEKYTEKELKDKSVLGRCVAGTSIKKGYGRIR